MSMIRPQLTQDTSSTSLEETENVTVISYRMPSRFVSCTESRESLGKRAQDVHRLLEIIEEVPVDSIYSHSHGITYAILIQTQELCPVTLRPGWHGAHKTGFFGNGWEWWNPSTSTTPRPYGLRWSAPPATTSTTPVARVGQSFRTFRIHSFAPHRSGLVPRSGRLSAIS